MNSFCVDNSFYLFSGAVRLESSNGNFDVKTSSSIAIEAFFNAATSRLVKGVMFAGNNGI